MNAPQVGDTIKWIGFHAGEAVVWQEKVINLIGTKDALEDGEGACELTNGHVVRRDDPRLEVVQNV